MLHTGMLSGKLPNKIKNIKYQLAKQGSGCLSTSATEWTKFTEPSHLTGILKI